MGGADITFTVAVLVLVIGKTAFCHATMITGCGRFAGCLRHIMLQGFAVRLTANATLSLALAGRRTARMGTCALGGDVTANRTSNVCGAVSVIGVGDMVSEISVSLSADAANSLGFASGSSAHTLVLNLSAALVALAVNHRVIATLVCDLSASVVTKVVLIRAVCMPQRADRLALGALTNRAFMLLRTRYGTSGGLGLIPIAVAVTVGGNSRDVSLVGTS